MLQEAKLNFFFYRLQTRVLLWFQIIGACVTNRFGGKVVLFYSVLLWSISTFITPFLVHSVPSLIFCRVLLGLGEGLGTYEEESIKSTLFYFQNVYAQRKNFIIVIVIHYFPFFNKLYLKYYCVMRVNAIVPPMVNFSPLIIYAGEKYLLKCPRVWIINRFFKMLLILLIIILTEILKISRVLFIYLWFTLSKIYFINR